MNRQWYRMGEGKTKDSPYGAQLIGENIEATEMAAIEWNRKGWGIFWTVNDFDGPRRIVNLRTFNAWAVDIDDGT